MSLNIAHYSAKMLRKLELYKSSHTKKYYKQIKQKKLYIIEEENKKKEENMSKNGEPTISFIPLSANNEGDLPTKVEALIKTMFPSYRP
uniref:Uncharacterized protein n=1 Tax=Heterorhabditis bacteriophora TaxID=37862 RepID=A0A1I7XVA1_HETBA